MVSQISLENKGKKISSLHSLTPPSSQCHNLGLVAVFLWSVQIEHLYSPVIKYANA